ncbi:hypothetical protein HAX54_043902, partial [Datura stramonium]|nr:hypothetical protein [Datura stramonium]
SGLRCSRFAVRALQSVVSDSTTDLITEKGSYGSRCDGFAICIWSSAVGAMTLKLQRNALHKLGEMSGAPRQRCLDLEKFDEHLGE